MEFIEILKELIEENETQTNLATKIGVKQSQISEWLSGKAKPGYDTIKAICVGLNKNPEYILGIEEESEKKETEQKIKMNIQNQINAKYYKCKIETKDNNKL